MSRRKISADFPWRCINCKAEVSDEQEICRRCGDRLRAKRNGPGEIHGAVTYPRQQTSGEYQMSDEYADRLCEAALNYAHAGIFVFPLRLYVRGDGRKGVSPIADWRNASTINQEIILNWFDGDWRGMAVAIDTGKSGLTVIDQDVDEGKNGIAVWAREGRPAMLRVRTPSGGQHDYYRADPEHPVTVHNRGEVGDGIDVRGEGGFVIAPPTIDPRGGCWEWIA